MGEMNVQAVSGAAQPAGASGGAQGQENTPWETTPPGQEEGQSLIEMIREAQEKAEAQRDALKLPKNTRRYSDAPLEAYARLARAKNAAQVNAASGYARRQIAQMQQALRQDGDNAIRIKGAISQLKKAVSRGEKKKRDLDRERLLQLRKARSQQQKAREELELRRRKTQRMIRESGYLREAEIAGRQAEQLTATQMELRSQAQALGSAVTAQADAVAQQYAAAAASAAQPAPEPGLSLEG